MFTGIIEEVGTIRSIRRGSRSAVLSIGCHIVLDGTKVGDSIAVNGTCLTVTEMGKDWFSADATPETVSRTSLSILHTGSPVNLERALRVGDRLGGHIVSGHVDGTGRIVSAASDENAVNVAISCGPELIRYILLKGSVAVDGVSLTVTQRDSRGFSVSIIPHTGNETILLTKQRGDPVNIECDVVGKYIEQLMEKPQSGVSMDLVTRVLG